MNASAKVVGIRSALFVGLTVISVPLAIPVGELVVEPLLSSLPIYPLPDSPFWDLIEDLVFDLPWNWPYLVLAPGVALAFVYWTAIGIAYGWLTRRIRLPWVALGVFPTVWLFGMGLAIATGI